MKKSSLVYLSLIYLSFLSCTKSTENKNPATDSLSKSTGSPSNRDIAFPKVAFLSKELSLSIQIDTGKKVLRVYNGKETTPSQIINFADAFESMSFLESFLTDPTMFIELEDLNFDAYQDLKVPSNQGSAGTWYDVYLFDPAKKEFIQNKELSEMTSLSADSASKTFSMRDIGGWAGAVYVSRVYRWENNKPYLIREESQNFMDDTQTDLVRSIMERGDGEMVLGCLVQIHESENAPIQYCLTEGDWRLLEEDKDFMKDVASGAIIKMDGRNGGCR
jgi:hypothetical protein